MDPIVLGCLCLIAVGVAGFVYAKFIAPSADASNDVDNTGLSMTPLTASAGAGGAAAGAGAGAADAAKLYPCTVYYGSQTGTAEGFAQQLANVAAHHGFNAVIADLEEFEPEHFTEPSGDPDKPKLALFMMATYGEGDPTDNAVSFYKWLNNKDGDLDDGALAGLRFSVFGLGNRQYEHYNSMGRKVNERLEALGAQRVYQYGEGDDDGTLEEDFDAWKAELWTGLRSNLGLATAAGAGAGAGAGGGAGGAGGADEDLEPPPLDWRVVHVGAPDDSESAVLAAGKARYAASGATSDMASRHYFHAKPIKVTVNRQLRQAPTPRDSTKHLELDLEASGLTYGTADDLAVLPENDPALVEAVARWLDYDLDQWFTLEPARPAGASARAPRPLFPTPCTVRTALARYCDLTCAPRKQFLGYMSTFAEKQSDRDRLRHLVSKAGKADFHAYVAEAQRSVYELFTDFGSVRPPLDRFLQLVPRLAVRYYTIASSSVVHPQSVHLAVSIIRTPKPAGDKSRELAGVCSNFLADRCTPGRVLYCDVRPSNFKLPADPALPVVMVGPGTGLAPMRAFLQERARQPDRGPTVLYFGCRRRDEDYIYKDELEAFVADGTLTTLHTAFSREQADKVYVQHRIKDTADELWQLLSAQRGHLYVCGATRMGDDVRAAVTDVAQTAGGLSADDAAAFVKRLRDEDRYIQELWS